MHKIKSRAATYVFLVVLLILVAADKPKLVKTKVTNEITALIPQGWIPMDAMDFTQRYPSVRAPLAAYTNEERTVDFSVNISATQWPDADLKLSQQFFKASLLNMFDRVEIIDEGIKEVNKRKFIAFEFESRVNGNRREQQQKDPILKYTYIQYLIEPGRTLVFSFNCPRRMKDEWQETARKMMAGLVVKSAASSKNKK
jgi:hypothetical protein